MLEAAKATGLPVVVTMTFDTAARSMMGVLPRDFTVFGNANNADFHGENSGIGPAELLQSIAGMGQANIDTPLIAKGNCGIPSYVEGAIHCHSMPPLMADYTLFAHDMGVRIIGGSCGTSPDHVSAIAQALAKTSVRPFDAVAMQRQLASLGRTFLKIWVMLAVANSARAAGNNAAMQILTPFAPRRNASCSLGS